MAWRTIRSGIQDWDRLERDGLALPLRADQAPFRRAMKQTAKKSKKTANK